MTFWVIITAMAALVATFLGQAVMRARSEEVTDARYFDLQVYRDQLDEIDRDVARGVLSQEDAERVRTEVSRRILSADTAARKSDSGGTAVRAPVLAALIVGIIASSLLLYAQIGAPGYGDLALNDRKAMAEEARQNRPTQQIAEESLPPRQPPELSEEFAGLLTRLRAVVVERPNDLQGQTFLAQYEAQIGNFSAAADAQRAVIELKGDAVTAAEIADYGELLVYAAGGYVSPEAEAAFRRALSVQPQESKSLYYVGLMLVQTGRPDIAFQIWDRLLRQGPPEAPWIAPIQAQIISVAELAGVNYTMPAIGPGDTRGPSAADIEAAADLSAAERMEMVSAMIQGLADRLATEGGPPQDWARLITSFAVTGQPAQAKAVFDEAMTVFADNPGALDIIGRAGSDAGVAE
ncbi:MAG: c-type cytochrome biogenesis protein CcmI [Pseudomonadota bacterium]